LELASTESIDVLDSLGSNIRVDIKGSEIVRILPKRNDLINEDWITDSVRYSFDGLKNQRFSYPMFYQKEHGFFRVSTWDNFYSSIFSSYLSTVSSGFTSSIALGASTDLYTSYLTDMLNKMMSSSSLISSSNISGVPSDIRSSYLFGDSFSFLNSTSAIIVDNLNLKEVFPLLNVRLKKVMNSKHPARIYYTGLSVESNIDAVHFSLNKSGLSSLLRGKSLFSSVLSSSQRSAVLSGSSFSSSSVYSLSSFQSISHHVLLDNVSSLHACELGVSLTSSSVANSFYYGLDVSNVSSSSLCDSSCVVLHGTHSNMSLSYIKSNLNASSMWYLPSYSFLEAELPYLNVLGLIQWTRKCISFFGDSRSSDDVLRRVLTIFLSRLNSSSMLHVQSFFDKLPNLLSTHSANVSLHIGTVNTNTELSSNVSFFSKHSPSFVRFSSTMSQVESKGRGKLNLSCFF